MSSFSSLSGRRIPLSAWIALNRLDRKTFGDTYTLGLLRGLFWIQKCKPGYVVLYDNEAKRVAAYASVLSLSRDWYEKIRNGEIKDVSLPIKAIRRFTKGKDHLFYCSSIVIDDNYQKGTTLLRLIHAVFGLFEEMAQNGVFAQKLLADAVTENGEDLCRRIGMEFIRESNHASRLYESDLTRLQIHVSSRHFPKFLELYRKAFES